MSQKNTIKDLWTIGTILSFVLFLFSSLQTLKSISYTVMDADFAGNAFLWQEIALFSVICAVICLYNALKSYEKAKAEPHKRRNKEKPNVE